MTAFEASINVGNIGLDKTDDNKQLTLHLGIVQALPFAGPDGQPMLAPLGSLSFGLDRETAMEIGQQLQAEGESLDPPSKLAVAHSIQDAEQAAKVTEQVTQKIK
jgi:hypothetical protein